MEPPTRIVHPGAFCSPGSTGHTRAGTPMACTVRDPNNPRERARYRRNTGPDAVPAIVQPFPTTANQPKISGKLLAGPLAENGWGYNPHLPVSYHPDGVIGRAVERMGGHALIDVDGKPLGDVLGELATDVVRLRKHPADVAADVSQLAYRLPPGRARDLVTEAAIEMSAPDLPVPSLPAGTPTPLVDLLAQLHAIPVCRADRGARSEVLNLVDLACEFTGGAMRRSAVIDGVRNLAHLRHESDGDRGRLLIVKLVIDAVNALQSLPPAALRPPART